MAKISIKVGDEWARDLMRLADQADAVAARAVAKGAGVIADQVRKNLEGLKEDDHYSPAHPEYYYLTDNEMFTGIPKSTKADLLDALGVTPVKTDRDGDINAKIGFDGYGSQPTQKYPKGLPNPLAARAVESGNTFRPKQPFVRPAVRQAKDKAVAAMQEVIEQALETIMK